MTSNSFPRSNNTNNISTLELKVIKPARRNHYPQILKIEHNANKIYDDDFETDTVLDCAWVDQQKFDTEAADKAIAIVCVGQGGYEENVFGFAVYKYNKKKKYINLLKFEGDKASQYEMLKHLETVCREYGYNKILITSHERRTDQHISLQNLGGIARKVQQKHFDDGDGFLFEFLTNS